MEVAKNQQLSCDKVELGKQNHWMIDNVVNYHSFSWAGFHF